ncbi:hypothetical protein [Actinoplanes sp. NPDC020271]|uniref:hypothetical protein n=1 Tax=Actinoplanes sp. NPDC020271 TaxID=3363896 RepID=UPI00379DBEF1
MPSIAGSSAAEEYTVLARAARELRQAHDELLLDPAADPAAVDAADRQALAAENLRNMKAAEVRKARERSATVEQDPPGASAAPPPAPVRAPAVRGLAGGSQRDVVADVLMLVGAPLRTADLKTAVLLLEHKTYTAAQFGQLRREEQRQFDRALRSPSSAKRTWYVVPCLSPDTLAAVSGTYALSSWPVTDRLVTSYAAQLWSAKAVVNLGRASLERAGAGGDHAGLDRLLQTVARGVSWTSGPIDVAQVIADASAYITRNRDKHSQEAAVATEQIAALAVQDPRVAFWGSDMPANTEALERRA